MTEKADDILGGFLDDEPESKEIKAEEPVKKEYRQKDRNEDQPVGMRYNWDKYLMEYLDGSFETIVEFAEWNEKKRLSGEHRPSMDSIKTKARKDKWLDKKTEVESKVVDRIIEGSSKLTKALKDKIDHRLEAQDRLTEALLKLVELLTNNPEHMTIKADLSDIINDTKRALGMRTKEEDVQVPEVAVGQGIIEINSRRKELEEANDDERLKLEKKKDRMNKALRKKLFPEADMDIVDVEVEIIKEDEE